MDFVSTLNHLAEISRDGAKGFADAAAAVQNPSLKTTLESASKRCETGARELDGEISKLGGQTDASGTTAGAMHRAWTNLKAAITGRDDKAILVECERGEDVAKAAYEEALRSNLPMASRRWSSVNTRASCRISTIWSSGCGTPPDAQRGGRTKGG